MHVYQTVELTEHDPRAEQPQKINTTLKPHQLAALQKAMTMERAGELKTIHFSTPPDNSQTQTPMTVRTNIGILGDIVGYGKTLEALAIIAATPVDDIHFNREVVMDISGTNEYYTRLQLVRERDRPRYLPTTLVVLPHGPVFDQWRKAIETQTSLRALVIKTIRDLASLPNASLPIDEYYEAYRQWDLIVVKTNTMARFMEHIEAFIEINPHISHPGHKWARIMVDEAHEALYNTPSMQFGFLWMISATYRGIGHRRSNYRQMMSSVSFLGYNPNHLNHCLVRNQDAFVKASFNIPSYIETNVVCKMPYGLNRIQSILSRDVRRLIEANDFQGAMRALNLPEAQTEVQITEGILTNLQTELDNLRHKVSYIQSLNIEETIRTQRLTAAEARIADVESRIRYIQEQSTRSLDVGNPGDHQCPVCFEDLKDMPAQEPPMRLPCAHTFCTPCILRWTYRMLITEMSVCRCPICRNNYTQSQMIPIVLPKPNPDPDAARTPAGPPEPKPELPSKEDAISNLIHANPEGKFLVFSSFDGSFRSIESQLIQKGITYAELKGTTSHMLHTLERFKSGELRCILLNTRHTGSGIDISFATDIILFHSNMGIIREQAIGRAQRVGRTIPLRVHNLVYESEQQQQNHS